jgi:TolA-binding protein
MSYFASIAGSGSIAGVVPLCRQQENQSPGDPDAQYHLGFVDMQQSKIDEAAALFRQVIAAHPHYFNAQYQLGKILLDRDRHRTQ